MDFFETKKKSVGDGLVWTNEKDTLKTIKLAVCLAFPLPQIPPSSVFAKAGVKVEFG